MRSYACMIGSDRGRPAAPGLIVCRPSAGIASATISPPAITSETTGRARTRPTIAPQTRDSPLVRWRSLETYGTRPFSVQPLRPRNESIAGRTVSEPTIATATTRIVPTAKDSKTALPARNIPAIATMTVMPEMSTARPDVAAAALSAASGERPASRSSISRRR